MTIVKDTIRVCFILILSTVACSAEEPKAVAFKDPPICSSFESPAQAHEYSCAVTTNGIDAKGEARKKVSIKLKAQTKTITIGGYQVETENYGTYLPPVVEARAGDTVAVDLENALGEPAIIHHHGCPSTAGEHLHGSNPTNLHYFHGGIVSPNNGNSPSSAHLGTGDNVYSCVERGKSFRYEVPIPGALQLDAEVLEGDQGTKIAHPPGLNWYHSHLHGISANQVMGGMAGLLSVGRRDENLRAICAPEAEDCEKKDEDLRRRTVVKYALLRDISIIRSADRWKSDPEGQKFDVTQKCGVATGIKFDTEDALLRRGFCQRGKIDNQSIADENRLWLFTINGQRFPTIEVDEDKTGLLLRLGNLSANVTYWLELYEEGKPDAAKTITVVSVDGVVPAKPQSQAASVSAYRVPDLLLMPSSRVEIYIDRSDIDIANGKTFVLRSKSFSLGIDVTGNEKAWPEVQLARITFKASERRPDNIALNVSAAEVAPVGLSLERAAPSEAIKRPPGCERDLREGEYRQVRFAANFNSEPVTWKIITSIMKNGKPQPDDEDPIRGQLIIDLPFETYVNKETHEIDWKTIHTCIELKRGTDSKPQLWELFNDTFELHNFHIHQMKFRLATAAEMKKLGIDLPKMSSTCQGQAKCASPDYRFYNDENPAGGSVSKLGKAISQEGETISSILEWHDTMPVPPNKRVYVMMSFADKAQVGRFVYHCHILDHEDNGLMAPIEVWDPSAPATGVLQ